MLATKITVISAALGAYTGGHYYIPDSRLPFS